MRVRRTLEPTKAGPEFFEPKTRRARSVPIPTGQERAARQVVAQPASFPILG